MAKGFRDLLYPDCCPACGSKMGPEKAYKFICPACGDTLERNLPPFCFSCGRHLEGVNLERNLCPACHTARFNFDRAFSPCRYEGVIKKLIHRFKYGGDDYLGKGLGEIMNDFIREYGLPVVDMDLIVPVPLHNSRLREREFNQAQILGEQVAKEFNKMLLPRALIRTRATRTQTELTPEERRRNLEDSFCISDAELIRGNNILLVDDVLTTGATSDQAAKSLKSAGAKRVFLLTLAS